MMRIAALLEAGVAKNPDKTAIFCGELAYTYRQLDELVGRLAHGFRERLGLVPGDVIAIQSSNTLEYVLTLLACWRSGLVLTPLNPALKPSEIHYQLEHSSAKAFVYEGYIADKAREAVSQLSRPVHQMVFGGERRDGELLFDHVFADTPLAPASLPGDTIALIIYTSGTTGRPKGVMLSHHNIQVMADMLTQALQVDEGDRALLVLPLFHVNAILCTLTVPLRQNGSVVIRKRFVLEEFFPVVDRYRPTYMSAVPTIYGLLANLPEGAEAGYRLDSLRFGICGGAPISQSVFNRFEQRYSIKLIEGWGLTETTMAATLNPVDGTRKVGSIGLPLPGQAVKVVNERGEELGPGEIGELIVKGENVMVGYHKNLEATRETVRDGWLYTGDVGYRDADGYFYIVDRKKDMIIRGGMNIYPRQIEEVIYRLPEVAEAAVIGVPDEIYGEEVLACVALKPGSQLTEEELIRFCRRYIADYKCPKRVAWMDSLPKNAVGKIDKAELRRRYGQKNG